MKVATVKSGSDMTELTAHAHETLETSNEEKAG